MLEDSKQNMWAFSYKLSIAQAKQASGMLRSLHTQFVFREKPLPVLSPDWLESGDVLRHST